MLFDMGLGEILVIGLVGLLIFGPERLPRAAAQAAQIIRQLREQANDARQTIMDAADIDSSTLRDLRDLDPRRALRDLSAPLDDVRREVQDVGGDVERRLRTDSTPPAAPDASGVDPRDIA